MNFMNGIRVGGEGNGSGTYGFGRRQMRRAIFLFLKYVVGWVEVSKVGSNWDNPTLSGASDGATDAADAGIFNSATGGFSALTPQSGDNRYYAIITGFTDSTRDGFYLIKKVVTDNQVLINVPYCGVHTDGLPLSETGLTWSVHDFKPNALLPANNDEFYLRGTGIGGSFQLHCLSDNTPSYSPDHFRVSPDNGSNWTAYTAGENEPHQDSGLIFGVADLTHAYFYVRYYDEDMETGSQNPSTYYFGDITAFRPADDTKPVVCFAERVNSDWNPWSSLIGGPIKSLTDGNVQIDHTLIYPTGHGNSSVSALGNARKTRSYYSGRFIRFPLVVVSNDNSYPEVRGYLKSLDGSHTYGDRVGTPFGTGRDRLRLPGSSMAWNGSKQYYYIF